jgi:hypothetical protein
VMRQDPDLPVECGCHHGIRIAVKHRGIRGDHSNVHHALAILRAFSTASSIPPTM